jgi:hypothetical protein
MFWRTEATSSGWTDSVRSLLCTDKKSTGTREMKVLQPQEEQRGMFGKMGVQNKMRDL